MLKKSILNSIGSSQFAFIRFARHYLFILITDLTMQKNLNGKKLIGEDEKNLSWRLTKFTHNPLFVSYHLKYLIAHFNKCSLLIDRVFLTGILHLECQISLKKISFKIEIFYCLEF